MRDNLNLPEIALDIYKYTSRTRLFLLLIIASIISSVASVWATHPPETKLWRWGDLGWEKVEELPGTIEQVMSADGNMIWVQTYNPDTLNRWDGTAWTSYQDFDLKDGYISGGFTTDGKHVWVASTVGVFHFDGSEWITYSDAISENPKSIVVSSLGVFVIGCHGNLSRFRDGEWTFTDVRDVLPGLTESSDDCDPHLFKATDGSILLKWNGLWRFFGERWQRVMVGDTPVISSQVIGLVGDDLWTIWDEALIVNSLNNSDYWDVHTFENIGLPGATKINGVSKLHNRTIFATHRGILQFDGAGEWKFLTTPDSRWSDIIWLTTSPDGNIWAIFEYESTNILVRLGIWLLTIVLSFVLIIGCFIYAFWQYRQTTAARKLVSAELADILPEPVKMRPQGLARIVLHNLPYLLFILAIFLLAIVKTLLSIISPTLSDLAIVFVAPAILLGSIFFSLWCYKWPVDRADYNRALQRIRFFKAWQPDRIYFPYFESTVLLIAGQFAEADACLQWCAARMQGKGAGLQSLILNNMALSAAYQNHTEKALRFAEVAIRLQPQMLACWTTLAEIYLESDIDPERALAVSEFSHKYAGQDGLTRLLGSENFSLNLGVQAWALAQVHETDKASTTIQKAIQQLRKNYKPGFAYLYDIQGRVRQAAGDIPGALEWLQRAYDTDPNGLYGKRALQHIHTIQKD